MAAAERLSLLAEMANFELREHILPYWYQTMDRRAGGFAGLVNDDGTCDFQQPKGVVMHSRHLWASSAAYLERRNPLDLAAATHAYEFLTTALYDPAGKGFWWTVDARGRPSVKNKVLYGQAFAVYGLAKYFQVTSQPRALELALETFRQLELAGHDRELGGYYEAVDRRWEVPVIQALSRTDLACSKSMNTNLHVLEAYTVLFQVTGLREVRDALESLLYVFESKIVGPSGHLGLYFDRDWTPLTDHESYGHDVEASWLMTEAAHVLWPEELPPGRSGKYSSLARTALALVEEHGALPNERHHGVVDTTRIWWVQAEALVGLVNGWQLTGDEAFLTAAERVWQWIDGHQADRIRGEWFWAVAADGTPDKTRPKGGLWKTSYHNGRACLELLQRARSVS
ncbi:MAG: AGE family epimerase/isomerase [Spirochaetales bacterium]